MDDARGLDPASIAQSLTVSERRAMMYREGASEACMSWDIAHALYDRGLTLGNARFLRLTRLGKKVRAALQEHRASADERESGAA